MLFCRLIDMGSLNISTNTFTDGSAFPTRTELGTSNSTWGTVLIEIEAALNSTPGNLTITYVDQDGNTAEATTSRTLTASSLAGSVAPMVFNTEDIGARDITTASRTGGTSPTGTLRFWGLDILTAVINVGTTSGEGFDLLTSKFSPVFLGATDQVSIICCNPTAANTRVVGALNFIGDST